MHNLETLGYCAQSPSQDGANTTIVRITAEHGTHFEVVGENIGRSLKSLTGSYADDRPAVGDFVVLEASGERIEALVQRRTALVRKEAGGRTKPQVIAANIDIVFVVTSMNDEFNESRLERYLAAVWESGAMPVVVLNKSDLAADPDEFLARAAACACGVDVVSTSAAFGDASDALKPWLARGKTYVLVGSSGVGKSTIVNALVGAEHQAVGAIREDDDEGRHTTTRRDLIVLDDDRGILIDTPGMRELGLWDAADGVASAFEDIERLASACRFRDCGHDGEPGCAIDAALSEGSLDERRLANYQKLQREIAYQERRRDAAATRAESRRWAKVVRNASKTRW